MRKIIKNQKAHGLFKGDKMIPEEDVTIESLTGRFNKAAKDLLNIEGHTFSSEQRKLSFVKKQIEIFENNPSTENKEDAADQVHLFESYVHSTALSGTDKLTRLPNRAAFNEQINTAVSKNGTKARGSMRAPSTDNDKIDEDNTSSKNQYFALIFLDLDRFKGLNDTHGHLTGDAGLKKFADKINDVIRVDDQQFFGGRSRAARIGGDEFTIVLNAATTTQEEAEKCFEKALERIRKEISVLSFEHGGMTFPIVASSGMHIIQGSDTPESAKEAADEAAYEHKGTKTERYEYAVNELKKQGLENLQIIEDKRGNEQEQLKIEQIGRTTKSLIDAGDLTMIVPAGTEPNAIKSLEDAGAKIIYEEPDAHKKEPELTQ